METINGLTKKQTIELLEDYVLYRLSHSGYYNSMLYICNYLHRHAGFCYTNSSDEFINWWGEKLYPENDNDEHFGIFGKPSNEQNDERIVFCLQIITELKSK